MTMQTLTGVATEAGPARARNYAGGRWVEPAAAQWIDIINPATARAIGRVPLSTAQDVDQVVQAARAAYPAWRETPPLQRARYMFTLRALLEAHLDDLARTVVLEHGKTLEDARGSVRRGIENVEVAAGIPSLLMGYGLEDGAARGIDEDVVKQPLGVFAAICPFNFPAMVPFWFWPYAVACGNTFIIKPSEQVPLTQQRIVELVEEAGFPPGVVNLVNGAKDTVDALLTHPDVQGISFVGSSPVAKYIYATAAAHGKRVQAQGGAKNVLVVMPDADLEQAVPNIIGSCFGAAGQRCLAGSLVMTVGEVHAPLARRLVEAAQALRLGFGLDEGVDMGPVISERARQRILTAIDQGVHEGADLLLDGRGARVPNYPEGYFVGPTVFDNVAPDMRLAREEIFGPVVGIIPVKTLDDAIALINRSPYGNAASIFTGEGRAARQFRYQVECGNIGVNVGVAAPMAYFPFGGYKHSFYGTLHGQGRDAIEFFTDRKVVISRWW